MTFTDYLLTAHIGFVNASIRGKRPLPFRPLARLPELSADIQERPDSARMNCGKPVSRREIAKKSGTAFNGANAQADAP